MSAQDLFALAIGALCHDVGHRGRNSAFEITTMGELAIRYNDRSPLENHHCATAFDTALSAESAERMSPTDSSSGCNIFKFMEKDVFMNIRKSMVRGILGTDMALHNDHVKQLKALTTPEEVMGAEGGTFAIELFMHAADIGNPLMPTDISLKWGDCIAAEFTAQVEEEKSLGLPITSMMAGLGDPKKNAASRLGFIDFVVMPLATPFYTIFPGLVENVKANLDANRESAKKMAAA